MYFWLGSRSAFQPPPNSPTACLEISFKGGLSVDWSLVFTYFTTPALFVSVLVFYPVFTGLSSPRFSLNDGTNNPASSRKSKNTRFTPGTITTSLIVKLYVLGLAINSPFLLFGPPCQIRTDTPFGNRFWDDRGYCYAKGGKKLFIKSWKPQGFQHLTIWRSEWDLNSRKGLPFAGFQDQCIDILTVLKDGDSWTHVQVFLFHSRMRNFYISSYISSAD